MTSRFYRPWRLIGFLAVAITMNWLCGPVVADEPPASSTDATAKDAASTGTESADEPASESSNNKARSFQEAKRRIIEGQRTQRTPPAQRGRKPSTARRGGPPKPTVELKPGEVPQIAFDTPEFYYGRVQAGTNVTHDFWFSNKGTGPLEILSVKPG